MYRTRAHRSTLFHAFTAVWVLGCAWGVLAQTRSAPPAKPNCETACRVNPVTAPPECDCTFKAGIGQPSPGPLPGPGGQPTPVAGGDATPAQILDLMRSSYEREMAGIDRYYFVETTPIVPRPVVREFERQSGPAPTGGGGSWFKEITIAEQATREQQAQPNQSADERALAANPQALLGGYAAAIDYLAWRLGMGAAAKPFSDQFLAVEAGLNAGLGNLEGGTDDAFGGLLGPEALALFERHSETTWATARWATIVTRNSSGEPNVVPVFDEIDGSNSGYRQYVVNAFYADGRHELEQYRLPCYVLSLPRNTVVEGVPHRLVSAEMWVCKIAPDVHKPVRTRVEYQTNAGDASPADLIVGGSRPVVIDQIAWEHLRVGGMHPAQKLNQSISGMDGGPARVIQKVRRYFAANRALTQEDRVKLIGEALAARPQ